MKKNHLIVTAIALSGAIYFTAPGRAADAPSKGGKEVKSSGQKAASNATANAAKAFERVSKELYPKAKQEGNLIVYSVWDVEHIRAVTDAFAKRYPGIKTTYWQGRNPEIVTRVLTEFQGGQPSVDTILSDNAPSVLRAAGAMASYETVQKDVLGSP